jgi:hypothetical protein
VEPMSDVRWFGAGVEIAADRRYTWVALTGVSEASRRVVVDMQAPLPGTRAAAALETLWAGRSLEWLALDPRSPSATLIEELKAEGMPLRLADTIGVATAHGRFADLLAADRLRIRGHPALDEAVRAAEARRLAGSMAIDRYGPVTDMAPLMAAELGCWALGDPDAALDGADVGVWFI